MSISAVVLLSGGLDSTTCLTLALSEGRDVYPISFGYGQRHAQEMMAANQVRGHFDISPERHRWVDLGRAVTGSALTGDTDVPLDRPLGEIDKHIPVTYVPARNIVFLAIAASYAEVVGATELWIGINALDYSGYPDCRPEFVAAFEEMLRVGTKSGVEGHPVRIRAPLVHLSKADIVRVGQRLGAPYHLTYSCYSGTVPSCGRCDACRLRLKGFREAGVSDPIAYQVTTGS